MSYKNNCSEGYIGLTYKLIKSIDNLPHHPKEWLTDVSDETARLLLQQKVPHTRPRFALQIVKVGGCIFIHAVHVLLF